MGIYLVFSLSVFVIDGVLGADEVMFLREGDPLALNTNVTKQKRDKMLWYFNDTLIAMINGEANKSCLFDGEGGRFRDKLEVDYESGSLTITNTGPEHAGRYEAEFIKIKSLGTSQSLNRNRKCDSTKVILKRGNIGNTIKTYFVSISSSLSSPGKAIEELNITEEKHDRNSFLSSGLTAGVFATFLLLIAATVASVISLRHRSHENDPEKKKLEHLLQT